MSDASFAGIVSRLFCADRQIDTEYKDYVCGVFLRISSILAPEV